MEVVDVKRAVRKLVLHPAAVAQGSMSSRAPTMIAHKKPKVMTLVELRLILFFRKNTNDVMNISFIKLRPQSTPLQG